MAYQVGLRHQASLGPAGGLAGGAVAILVAVALTASAAFATESGRNPFPNGLNGIGVGNLPPPGLYLANEFLYIRGDRFNDSNGNKAFPNFKLDSEAYAARFLWNSGVKVLGADWITQLVVPVVRVSVKNLPPPGVPLIPGVTSPPFFNRQTKSGIGDITLTQLLAWHTPNFHYAAGFDVTLPTASFESNRPVNIGQGYFTFSPAVAATWLIDGFELSSKLTFDINFENNETNYNSGEAALVDYSFGYRWEKEWGKLLLGIGGYYYHQFSDDKVNGITVFDGFRGKALGIGPQIQYQHPIGAILELKYQKDFEVENRAEGDRFIARFLLRF
jgi:hypothetical protein